MGSGAAVERATVTQGFRAQLVVPEQRQLFDYWLELAGNDKVPRRADFNPARLPRLLPGVCLVDVAAEIGKSRIRLAGTRLREIYDCEITGMSVDDVPCANRLEYWLTAYQRTVTQALPTQGIVRGPLVNKEHVVQYWLKLPLRTTGEDVGMVLCYDHFVPASEFLHDQRVSASS